MIQPLQRKLRHLLLLASVTLLPSVSALSAPPNWKVLVPGLEFARIPLPATVAPADSFIAVLRADPSRWDLVALSATDRDDSTGHSARGWARSFGLTATINAGMYDRDRITHIGQFVTRNHSHNMKIHSRYRSLAVFDPVVPGDVPFAILDRETNSFADAARRWNGRVQNLRLIRTPGENRWQEDRKKWSEAALGEDNAGRILFLYCPAALSMHDFNEAVLGMPLDIQAAQHLEGGVRAQLYIDTGTTKIEFHSGRETDFSLGYEPTEGIVIPNVLGLTARKGN